MFAGCYQEILFLLLYYSNINLKFPPNFLLFLLQSQNHKTRDHKMFHIRFGFKNTKNVSVFLLVSQIENTNQKNKYINELII